MVAPEQVVRTLNVLEERAGAIALDVFTNPHLGLHRALAAGEVPPAKLIEWMTDFELIALDNNVIRETKLGTSLHAQLKADTWKTEMALATLAAPKCRKMVKGFADRAFVSPTGQVLLKQGSAVNEKERSLLFLYRRLGMADTKDSQWVFYGELGDIIAAELNIGLTPEELYQKLSAQRRLGEFGENVVKSFEQARLTKLGFKDLADRVKRISLENTAAGFDVQSFEGSTNPLPDRFIEVKTTTGEVPHFFLPRNELAKAEILGEKYLIACVLGANVSAGTHTEIKWYRNPIESVLKSPLFKVEPVTFEVTWAG